MGKLLEAVSEGVVAPRFSERKFAGTDKQLRFIDEWANGNSVSAAAMRAGYSDGGAAAYQMVTMPEVLALYTKKVKAREVAAQITNKRFMDMLMEAYDMAKMQAEPMTMVAAAREIGKACGYYAPTEKRIKVEGNVVLDKMNKMSDAELLELIQQPAQALAPVVEAIEEAIAEDDDDEVEG